MTDQQVFDEASVRLYGRFPTVAYVHKYGCNEDKPKGLGCAIYRCAEPTANHKTHVYLSALS